MKAKEGYTFLTLGVKRKVEWVVYTMPDGRKIKISVDKKRGSFKVSSELPWDVEVDREIREEED